MVLVLTFPGVLRAEYRRLRNKHHIRQFIAAGLVDEIGIHLVPVLFGSGTRLFEQRDGDHVQLEPVDVVQTPVAVHLRFRVRR